jgi:glycosyltransferase involved in cell wall biosynthesis
VTTSTPRRGAILALPTTPTGQHGPVAAWLSTAGWASGVRRVLGEAWIVTASGLVDEASVRSEASHAQLAPPSGRAPHHRVPIVAKTAFKDAREWRRAQQFAVTADGPWRANDVVFVWQRHELFHRAGLRLARRLGVPSVLFVPAPLVWQAKHWGTRRPGYASAIEHFGETRSFVRADVVAVGSEAVAEHLARLGVAERRLVVTPTGLDPDVFGELRNGRSLRRSLQLDGRFVVGWVGSFRNFHGLDQAVDALVDMPDATLLLVGDGPERCRIEERARRGGVAVVSTGTVPHDAVPELLAAMDVGLVLAPAGQPFHYSPLKLAEYLASGVAVVAPRAGGIPSQLADGSEALLFEPADVADLARCLRRLRDEPEDRARLAAAGRRAALDRWSWDRSVERVVAAVENGAGTLSTRAI